MNLKRNYFLDSKYILPIVHSSADFISPLKFGDEIICEVTVGNIGKTSFELHYCINKGKKLVSKLLTKHVVVLKSEFKKTKIPQELLDNLKANQG